jgi:hypothetical protein
MWAGELIEPAEAVDHRRLAQLYVIASQCHAAGRITDAVRLADSGLIATGSRRFDEVPFGLEAAIVAVYSMVGHPEEAVIPLRKMIARTPGTHILERACLVLALVNARAGDEARAEAEGLLAAAEATDTPNVKSLALTAYGWAFHDADPASAYDVSRRALKIAQDSGCRYLESVIALGLSRLAGGRRDPVEAFGFLTIAIRNYHDSGSFLLMHGPLAILGTILDRLGNYQSAATLVGFAAGAATLQTLPELHTAIAHLREVLGDDAYESLASAGASMTNAAMASFAFEQIDRSCGSPAERFSVNEMPRRRVSSLFCSPTSRGRPGAGKPTRRQCGQRCRSRQFNAGDRCSARRLAVQAHWRRRVRGLLVTSICCRRCRRRATDAGIAGAVGDRHRRGRATRGRLLRRGTQSGSARDGGRPQRPDPSRRRHRANDQRCGSNRPGAKAFT